MWNLKNIKNKQNRHRLVDTESKLNVAREEKGWRAG